MFRTVSIIILVLAALPALALAQPSVSGVSGTIGHGETITISGSAFGAKPTAAPVLWDDFEDNNFTGWSFVGDGSSWQISSSPARGSYAAHKTDAAATDRMQIYPATGQSFYYTSFWFQPAANYTGNSNDKHVRLGESSGQSNLVFGRDFDTVETTPCSQYDTQVVYRGTATTSYNESWKFVEVYADVAGDTATILVDGQILSQFPRSGCDTVWTAWDNTPYIAYGAWFGTAGIQDGWYFDDIYIDYTPARAMICEGSTWSTRGQCEMQIPTSWSTSEIAVTVNRGGFGATDSAYLYVVDGSNDANSSGFAITFGDEGGGDPDPPPAADNPNCYRYTGSAWVACDGYQYSGSAWVALSSGTVDPPVEFSCTGYEVCQHFEGTGYDNSESGWFTGFSGTQSGAVMDPDYTTDPIEALQSLRMVAGGSGNEGTWAGTIHTAASKAGYFFLMRVVNLPLSSTPGTWADVASLWSLDGENPSQVMAVLIDYTGNMRLAWSGSSAAATPALAVAEDTEMCAWVDWEIGTGDNGYAALYLAQAVASGDDWSCTKPGTAAITTSQHANTEQKAAYLLTTMRESASEIVFDRALLKLGSYIGNVIPE